MQSLTVWLVQGAVSYRAVEHALAIHGNVEATLHSLDGHHSQTHRNKIKQGCRADRVGKRGGERARQTDTKRQRQKRDIRQKGQNRTIEFSLNSCRHHSLWSLFFGYLSAVKWTAQDMDIGNTDAPQCDSEALVLSRNQKNDAKKDGRASNKHCCSDPATWIKMSSTNQITYLIICYLLSDEITQ